jgi:uncharacterized protein
MDRKTFRLKAATTQAGEFSALLSPYGGPPDSYDDVIDPGAYAEDLALNGTRRPLLSSHDPEKSIGWIELQDRPDGLYISTGKLLIEEIEQAREDYARLKAGILTGVSIGFESLDESFVQGVRHLKSIRLFEGSLVMFPAADRARVTEVRHANGVGDLLRSLTRLTTNVRGAADQVKSGRVLSSVTHATLQDVHTSINTALDKLSALLVEHDPTDDADDEKEKAALVASLQRTTHDIHRAITR